MAVWFEVMVELLAVPIVFRLVAVVLAVPVVFLLVNVALILSASYLFDLLIKKLYIYAIVFIDSKMAKRH